MPLQKQAINVNFKLGVDTKTDPWQLDLGRFLSIQNSVFTVGKRLTKRNGYQSLASLPYSASFATTFKNDLTVVGTNIETYNAPNMKWVTKGDIVPVEISTLSLVRNNLNQTQCDSVISSNGLVCTVYTESSLNATGYRYVIADSVTGQNIIPPTDIPGAANTFGTPRIFLLDNYFIILYLTSAALSAPSTLSYVAININSPSSPMAPVNIAVDLLIVDGICFDAAVLNNNLYISYQATSGTGDINALFLTSTLALSSTVTVISANNTFTFVTVCADVSQSNIWVTAFSSSGQTITVPLDINLHLLHANISINSSSNINKLSSSAQNGLLTVFLEQSNTYGYDNTLVTNNTVLQTVTLSGTISPGFDTYTPVIRGAAIASKSFIVNEVIYIVVEYQSAYQDTYFLINASGNIIAKLAYGNGGLTLDEFVSSVSVDGNKASFSYLVKESVQAVNKNTNVGVGIQTAGIYSQVGLNLASFEIGSSVFAVETGNNLNLSGGFLWAYDGFQTVDQNFFLWPDSVEVTTNPTPVSVTGTLNDNTSITSLSSMVGIAVGAVISGTNINASPPTTIVSVDVPNSSLVMSFGASGSGSETLTITGNISSGVSPTGDVTSGSDIIVNISNMAGIFVSGTISGTGIPAGATITSVNPANSSITISEAASATNTGVTLTIGGDTSSGIVPTDFYQATYEWSDNQGNLFRSAPSIPVSVPITGYNSINTINIPTLRATYKITNPVKIVLYRWSTTQQVYYQVTSISMPVLNDPTIDYVTIYDAYSDSQIIGNNILYTNGGVLENIGPPGFNSIFSFDDRLWGIESEDPNSVWYSKQILASTPVEMSDLLTFYVAPGLSASGPTGPLRCGCPMDDKLILFKDSAIYYINGTGPDATGANNQYSEPVFITSMVGCSNQKSIIFQPEGLMFEFSAPTGNQIWLLGRDLSTKYIGDAVEDLTKNADILSSLSIPGTNQVRFHMSNGTTLMYDYYYAQWGPFSTKGSSSTLYQGLHTYIAANGNLLQETPGKYLDSQESVLLSFTTSWINLAGIQGYERLYYFYLLMEYLSPHFLNVQIAYDYNPSVVQSKIISPQNFSSSVPSGYGVPVPFGSPGTLEQWKFHAKKQLCESFQITVSEVFNPTLGTVSGAGFTMSGLTLVVGLKKGYVPIRAANTVG